jgi:hypothetical protein
MLDPIQRPWCAFSSLDLLLRQLTAQTQSAEIWLAPLTRRQWFGPSLHVTVGVLVSGAHPLEQWVGLCQVRAAEAHLSGTAGRLLYPHFSPIDPRVQDILARLQRELLEVLPQVLRQDARVRTIQCQYAPLVLDQQAWSEQALIGFPLAYQHGHWRFITVPFSPPS